MAGDRVLGGITPGCSITDITTGPDGNLWFAEYANQAIGRITPQGQAVEFPLPNDAGAPGFPSSIAVGPDRNLWFVRRNGVVGRITPQGSITEFHDGITGFGSQVTTTELPTRIVVGRRRCTLVHRARRSDRAHHHRGRRDGVPRGDHDLLLEPARHAGGDRGRARRQPLVHRSPGGGRAHQDDGRRDRVHAGDRTERRTRRDRRRLRWEPWFTEFYGGRIGRITPRGRSPSSRRHHSEQLPVRYRSRPDGNLWFGDRQGRIGRITPQGTVTEFAAGPNANPTAVTRGPDDAIWYATSDRIGRLGPAGGGVGGGSTGGRPVRPRRDPRSDQPRTPAVTVSRRVILTARVGHHRLRVALHTAATSPPPAGLDRSTRPPRSHTPSRRPRRRWPPASCSAAGPRPAAVTGRRWVLVLAGLLGSQR